MKEYSFDDIIREGLLLYRYIRGSQAYGTATDTSDIDEGGVFMSPVEQLLGLGYDYKEQLADDKNDKVWLELNKYMRLLIKSNPTVLESLYIGQECVLFESPVMTELKKNRDLFLTKDCFDSFGGYAVSQISKCRGLHKKFVNPVVNRKGVIDFCYTFYKQGSTSIENWLSHRGLRQEFCGLVNVPNMPTMFSLFYDFGSHFDIDGITEGEFYRAWLYKDNETPIGLMANFVVNELGVDPVVLNTWFQSQHPIGYRGIVKQDDTSNEVRLSSVVKGEKPICYLSYYKDSYIQHCRKYKEYKDWEKNRNPVRYKSNIGKTYDAKNVSHSFRLIAMCTEIARGEGFIVNRTGRDADFLLDVKNHKYAYEEVIAMLDERKAEMDKAIAASTLPDSVDVDKVNDLLLSLRFSQIKGV
ncbi:MAG: nucleotidyltransferase domain-containing protein [Paludibacteraceae bacterium]|nr:nucleotidyltransferase domain-containing protein [Paludibacteraceae bacterium]